MALPDLYHRRKKQAEKTQADVYQYTKLSLKVRQQIILLIRKHALATDFLDFYQSIVQTLREEIGSERISNEYEFNTEFDSWFRLDDDLELLLSAVELASRLILVIGRQHYHPDEAVKFVSSVNARLLEDGVGYQIEDYRITRVDSQFLHSDVVIPVLQLLNGKGYTAANDEFRQAHKEYVDGNYDDCIHDCCNAFESVMKVILTKKGWAFNPNDTAKKLLDAIFTNNLIPAYMQAEFTGLRTILESGVPTVRNKDGGHGAGVNPRKIPDYIASFQLHQTAAAILLIVKASE